MLFLTLTSPTLPFSWPFFSRTPTPRAQIIQAPRFTLMIDPAGDPGRKIDTIPERTLTLQFATTLKKDLEAKIPGLRVILTQSDGETVDPLQQASFANRVAVNLYLSLHIVKQTDTTPKVYIYHPLYNPENDLWDKKSDTLTLVPYDQAYQLTLRKTATFATLLYQQCKQRAYSLAKERKFSIICMPPLGIPFKPLSGITAPGIGVELGIKKKSDLEELATLMIEALECIIIQKSP